MLAALRSMLPKTWDQDHETAWNWLWENIERLLKDVLYKPPVWEPALAQLMAEICEEDRAELNNNVYTRFFQVAPQGQDFFKQSNTRLQFIASRVALMVGELFADPWKMTEEISAVGLRHVGYGIPTDLVGPFVSVCIEVLEAFAPEKTSALEAYRWGLSLIAKILNRVINEGSTVVMKAINANSASLLRRAVACAPRGERAVWLLRIQVGTQRISPLSWAIESGSFGAARAMLEDLLTIRADRERYYYGIDHLFENHPDIIERLCVDAPSLLNTLLHGLVWRSRRTVNGLRRVNFFVKYLLVTADGCFAKALDAFAQANDVKIISHPVLVLVSDTLWAGVVRRQFIVSKLDFLFSLLVFMLCQAILPKLGNESNKGLAWSILVGRTMNYVFNFARLFGIHTKCFFRAYRTGDTTKVAGVPLPTTYLQDQDSQMSILLLLSLILMCISEPFYYCLPSISSTGPTEECDAAQPVIGRYIIFSMSAMVLHWLLLVDMSVFSTGLAAFVLVCRHVISEVGKFLVAMVFLLLTFASAISCLKHNSKELDSVLGAANCLFALTVGLYEGDYRDFLLDPTLLIPVLIFVTLSAILLINLLIAQLNCSYDYVYADMLGFARLSRAALIVDTMSSCPAGRFTKFVAGLRFQKLLEFDEGDVGLGGGIQTREFANLNPISVDTIRRFGGASSPQMQWPEEEGDEEDKMVRIQKLLVLINKEASASEKVEKRLQRKSKDRATVASTVDGAIHSRASAGQSSLGEEPIKSGISNPRSGSEGH
ncbi:unnamed protein product [Polarella glacialis]|uniref:Globin family profile domain-containing protein n=1 Tax=Polarella glacialis TaxID=89957 RepID=A0A813I0F9_POLGL|nr:unnamed protein product [Polarella glacialis]